MDYRINIFRILILVGFLQIGQITYAQVKDSVAVDSVNVSKGILPAGDVREANPILTGNDLIEANFPGSWPMFGTDLRMKIGGYVKADMVYDFDGTLDKTQFLMSSIPVKGQPTYSNSGYINLFAKETRFNIDIRRIGENKVPLRLMIEGDFFTSNNQFRLRHAYLAVGDFIIGQTWTTLTVLESLPFLIDFAAGDALFGGRATQVRFSKKLNNEFKLAIGIEQLNSLGIENSNLLIGESSARFPLLAIRIDKSWKNGLVVLGTSLAELRWDGGDNPNPTAIQYSLLFTGRQYLGKNNYFTWNVSYGVGNGENIIAFIGSNANAVLQSPNSLREMPSFSMLIGFMHKWNDFLSSNFSYNYGWLDTPPSRDPFALKRGGVGHMNLIYKVSKNVSTGIEYMRGTQRTTNDALGTANRIQVMTKFDF